MTGFTKDRPLYSFTLVGRRGFNDESRSGSTYAIE